MIAQPGVNTLVNPVNRTFHQGFVFGMSHTRGDNHAAVMVGKILQNVVYTGLVAVGFYHCCLEVIGD